MKRLNKNKEWERLLAEAEIRKSNRIAKEKRKFASKNHFFKVSFSLSSEKKLA